MVKVNLINCFSQWLCGGNLHITSSKFIIQKTSTTQNNIPLRNYSIITPKARNGQKFKF